MTRVPSKPHERQEALLEARGLGLTYPNGVRAVDRFDASFHAGEFYCMLGPNGAGKSSLLRLLAGLGGPRAEGELRMRGEDCRRLSTRERARRLAFVGQDIRVPRDLPVLDLVLAARYPYLPFLGSPSAHDLEVARRSLESLDALGFQDRLFGELSAGEGQRVLLARALAQESDVILLDEPASSLDPGHKVEIFERLAALPEGNKALIVVTHELNLASQFASTLLVLDRGQLCAEGNPGEVLRAEILDPIYGSTLFYGALPSGAAGEERPFVLPWQREP